MASFVVGTGLIPVRQNGTVSGKNPLIERRSKVRYPIEAPISFRSMDKFEFSGDGQVINMSSVSLLVSSAHQPSVGTMLQLRMRWPNLLEQRVQLQFITVGKVVRCSVSSFAVSFHAHKFRTGGLLGSTWAPFAEA